MTQVFKPLVSVIVTNYMRPENIGPILKDWRDQSADPARLILVNAPATHKYQVDVKDRIDFDLVLDVPNIGCYTRYLAAPWIDTEYALFVDDDFKPGYCALANYIACARSTSNRFACLGEIGRHLPADLSYTNRDVVRSHLLKRVDYVCRSYFYYAPNLALLDAHRRSLWPQGFPREDDMFTQALIQIHTGLPSYILPKCDISANAICNEMPAPHANSESGDHAASRVATAKALVERGWIPQSRSKGCRSCGK